MAQLIRFCNLVSLFSSTYGNDIAYRNLWTELYGCKMYLKFTMVELMDMPVYVRKFFIDKYNGDNNDSAQEQNTTSVSGVNINTYAAMEQANINNSNNRK